MASTTIAISVVRSVILRGIEEQDDEACKRLFDEAYSEYVEHMKRERPEQYLKERFVRENFTVDLESYKHRKLAFMRFDKLQR